MSRLIPSFFPARLQHFLRDESGVALIEFAFALPMFMAVFSLSISSSRMMMSYDAAVAGVRDASRYLARVAPQNICSTGGSLAGYSSQLQSLVQQGLSSQPVLPSGITITSVTPSYACFPTGYRNGPVAVVQVTADLGLTFPFAGAINWATGGNFSDFTTSVTQQSRVEE